MDEILHESKLTLFHPQCADVFGSGVQSGDIISDRKRIFLNQVRYEIIKTRFEAYLQMVEISPSWYPGRLTVAVRIQQSLPPAGSKVEDEKFKTCAPNLYHDAACKNFKERLTNQRVQDIPTPPVLPIKFQTNSEKLNHFSQLYDATNTDI